MDIIASKDNSKIKYVRSLYARKNRDTDFVVEGIKFVKEAINENVNIKFILIAEGETEKAEFSDLIEIIKKDKTEYYFCDDNIFNYASETVSAQGVLAVVSKIKYKEENIFNDCRLIILCDRIQDPGNLGTIIRTADAFGPAAVILTKGCVDAFNSKVIRAAAGALFRVPIISSDIDHGIIDIIKASGFKVISSVVNSPFSFDAIEKSKKICIVIGNEGQGISQEILDNSDKKITIEMPGRAESLNASVAAGICIYEIRKKLL